MKLDKSKNYTPRKPSIGISLIPIVSVFVFLLLALIKYDIDIQIPLIAASIVAALISSLVLKNK